MRTPAILFLLLSLSAAASAQVQEKKLMDRLNMSQDEILKMKYDLRSSSFGGKSVDTRGAITKEFGGSKEFNSRTYLSKTFSGSKSSWLSGIFFKSKEAGTKGKYEIPNAGKAVDTKEAGSKDAFESNKEAGTLAFLPGETKYLKRDRFDATPRMTPENGGKPLGYQGNSLRQMSIDDIREILNKNK